ncbi:MAG TPA: F0F1 ATP synthase subunit A [Thermoanaerobaculia bacterium]|nr:F0F1 ATP synthase subunit A [Thermoanaerobaculia bacterium]
MEHHHSIVYGPVNALWDWLLALLGLEQRWGHVEVPDHVAMSLFVVALLAAVFIPLARTFREEEPGRFQLFLEQLVQGLRGMIDEQVGHGAADRYLSVIGAFTLFIFVGNICGLFFFLVPPTQNVNVTFGLAFVSFFLYNIIGFRRHGLRYFKHFLGPIWWLAPLFVVVELVSHNARWLSLGLRLFGNMTGEHMVAGVFNNLVPLLAPLPIMALGAFAAIIQTFIFIMLTTVYIAGAEAEEH